jgi:hypothetical protein
MAEKVSFWKGVSTGFLAGMAVAAALRYSPFEKFISNLSTVDGKLNRDLEKVPEKLSPTEVRGPAVVNFVFRREQSETEEEPATSEPAKADPVASFLRSGDASGRRTTEESSFPGDHIDLTKPLRPYPRSLDLGSAG